MTQALATFLFFYVFGLGAILLTGYMIWTVIRYVREQKKRGNT